MHRVQITAPTRIDLAGGTLDLWPLHQLLEHPVTVNASLDLPAWVSLQQRMDQQFAITSEDQQRSIEGDFLQVTDPTNDLPLVGLFLRHFWSKDLPGLDITLRAKSPAGAGLGGSSCLSVTLLRALTEMKAQLDASSSPHLSESDLVMAAQDIEARLIQAPTGCQDYWGAVRGGINILTFPPGGVQVETHSSMLVNELNEQLVVCYSGKSRQSAINNWEIFKGVFDGDKRLLATLNEIASVATDCAQAVREANLARALECSEQEWRLRCQLWPAIETEETKRLDEAAKKAGADFSRVCGAGGGGVMAVFVNPAQRDSVIAALGANGGSVLDATVVTEGLRQIHA